MDPLAHTLVGATLAETGLRRRSPLATATLVWGANAPDIDAAASVFGADAQLLLRRGHTHGVLAMVALPLVLTGVMALYDRFWRRRRDPDAEPADLRVIVGLSFLSVLSHPALDFLNTYGVRLLMPFDGSWFYGDALFIIDPWMWLLVAAAVVLARSERRISKAAWIVLGVATTALVTGTAWAPWPAKVIWVLGVAAIVVMRLRGLSPERVRVVAGACVATLVVYIATMLTGTAVARAQVEAWLEVRGESAEEIFAGPKPANPFFREIIVVTPEQYRFLRVDWLADETIAVSEEALPRGSRDAVVEAALLHLPGLRNWMRYPAFVVEAEEGGHRVTIKDVRYSRRMDGGLGWAQVRLNEDLTLRSPPLTSRRPSSD